MIKRELWRIALSIMLIGFWSSAFIRDVHASAQYSSTSIDFGPNYQTAAPGEEVTYYVSVSVRSDRLAGFHGSVMVTLSPDLILPQDPVCLAGCNSVSATTGVSTILESSFRLYDGEQAEISFSVQIPEDASVGTSYTLIAYLIGGEHTGSSSETKFASLIVADLPAADDNNNQEEAHVAGMYASPRAVRLAPDGRFTMIIRPYASSSASGASPSVEISIPRSLKVVEGPYCVSDLSDLSEKKKCITSNEAGPSGSALRTVDPPYTNGTMDSIVLTLAPSDQGEGDFSQVVATLDGVGDGYAVESLVAITNVNFAGIETVRTANDNHSQWILLELTHDYKTVDRACSSNRTDSPTEIGIELWNDPDSYTVLNAFPGFLAESTSDVQSQSCFIPFSLPSVPDSSIYAIKAGHCLRCGIGLFAPSSEADQVILDTDI